MQVLAQQPPLATRPAVRVAVVMDREAWFGSMKDTFEILGDIVSPANDEDEWEVLRD